MSEEQQETSNKILFWVKQILSPIFVPVIVAFIVGHYTVKSAIESIAISNEQNLEIALQNNAALAETTKNSNQALLEVTKQNNSALFEATKKSNQALLKSVELTNETTLKAVQETNEYTVEQIRLDHELKLAEKKKENLEKSRRIYISIMGDIHKRLQELEVLFEGYDSMVKLNSQLQYTNYAEILQLSEYFNPDLYTYLSLVEAYFNSGTYPKEESFSTEVPGTDDFMVKSFYKSCQHVSILSQSITKHRLEMTSQEKFAYFNQMMDH